MKRNPLLILRKLRGNHYQAERIPVLVQVVGFDTHQGAVTAVQVQQRLGRALRAPRASLGALTGVMGSRDVENTKRCLA